MWGETYPRILSSLTQNVVLGKGEEKRDLCILSNWTRKRRLTNLAEVNKTGSDGRSSAVGGEYRKKQCWTRKRQPKAAGGIQNR